MRISCGSSDVCSSDLYAVEDGMLAVTLGGGAKTGLADPSKLAGWRGDAGAPEAILLVDNGLHIEIRIDRDHSIGRTDPAGVADVQVEAARSEEHTSELQSLMRISYAVFCLNNKT